MPSTIRHHQLNSASSSSAGRFFPFPQQLPGWGRGSEGRGRLCVEGEEGKEVWAIHRPWPVGMGVRRETDKLRAGWLPSVIQACVALSPPLQDGLLPQEKMSRSTHSLGRPRKWRDREAAVGPGRCHWGPGSRGFNSSMAVP